MPERKVRANSRRHERGVCDNTAAASVWYTQEDPTILVELTPCSTFRRDADFIAAKLAPWRDPGHCVCHWQHCTVRTSSMRKSYANPCGLASVYHRS